MSYFVTFDGVEIAGNLTKTQAIKEANKTYKKAGCTLRIGIGRIRYIRGEKISVCLPLHFF